MNENTIFYGEAENLAGEALKVNADGAAYLVGSSCGECKKRVFPPTNVCPDCMSENLTALPLSKRGTLYSWSIVHVAPKGWHLPFIAAYVDLPEEVRIFTHLVEVAPEDLVFDMPVEVRIAELGIDEKNHAVKSYAFSPLQPEKS